MFGIFPAPTMISVIVIGAVGMAVLAFQMLVGYRKIEFKGRTHMRVHKGLAWLIFVVSVVHLIWALGYLGFLTS
jgi:hypothetical protein